MGLAQSTSAHNSCTCCRSQGSWCSGLFKPVSRWRLNRWLYWYVMLKLTKKLDWLMYKSKKQHTRAVAMREMSGSSKPWTNHNKSWGLFLDGGSSIVGAAPQTAPPWLGVCLFHQQFIHSTNLLPLFYPQLGPPPRLLIHTALSNKVSTLARAQLHIIYHGWSHAG